MTMSLLNRCNECNLQFTSKAILTDHLAGKRHKKKVQTLNISNQNAELNETKLVCNVCGVSVNSLLQYQAHLKGTKHLSKTDKNVANKVKIQPTKTESTLVKKNGNSTSSTSTSDQLLKPTKKNKESFSCESCHITTNSKCQYDIHIMSQKHKAKVQGKTTTIKKVSFKYKTTKEVKPILKKAFGVGGYIKHSQTHCYANGQVFYNNMNGKKDFAVSSSFVSSENNSGAPSKQTFPNHFGKPYKDSIQNFIPSQRDSFGHVGNHGNMRQNYDRSYFCVVDEPQPHYFGRPPNFERCHY